MPLHDERPSIQLQSIDHGLQQALKDARPGEPMSLRQIARYCRCSPQAIARIERQALRNIHIRVRHLRDAI